MTLKVKLLDQKFNWEKIENTYTRGYAWYKNKFYQGKSFANLIDQQQSMQQLIPVLKELNGHFAIISKKQNQTIAACDLVRSMPLFYKNKAPFLIVDALNNENELLKENSLDEDTSKEFVFLGFISGKKTLLKNWNQVQAGEYVIFDENTFQYKNHSVFDQSFDSEIPEDQLVENFKNILFNVFKKHVDVLDGRPVWVPLSGGCDSRLVVKALRDFNYKNVHCFSYGRPKNQEAQISKKVAEFLGYDWHFIPHSRSKMKNWFQLNKRKEYCKFSRNFSSLAHMQDWPAVYELFKNKMIHKDAIFLPGHALDYTVGSHLKKVFTKKQSFHRNEVIDLILQRHFNLWKKDFHHHKDMFFKMVSKQIPDQENLNAQEAANVYEMWDWRERQPKLVANSLRVYEFFDHTWMMPLWDKEIVAFAGKIPLHLKYKRKLFFKFFNQNHNFVPVAYNYESSLYEKIGDRIFKICDRVFDDWRGRFSGDRFLPFALNEKLSHHFDGLYQKFSLKNHHIYKSHTIGLNTLYQLKEVLENQNS